METKNRTAILALLGISGLLSVGLPAAAQNAPDPAFNNSMLDIDAETKRLIAEEDALLKELQTRDAERAAANQIKVQKAAIEVKSADPATGITTAPVSETKEVAASAAAIESTEAVVKVRAIVAEEKPVEPSRSAAATVDDTLAATANGVVDTEMIATAPSSRKERSNQNELKPSKAVSAAENKTVRELQRIVDQQDGLKAELREKMAQAEVLRAANNDLKGKVGSLEAKVARLEGELAETRDRLIVAETEVERVTSARMAAHAGAVDRSTQTKAISAAELRRSTESGRITSVAAIASNDAPTTVRRVTTIKTAPAVKEVARPAPAKAADDMPIATVIVDKANLRTGPGGDNSPLMSISKGTRLAVETRRGEWYRVIAPTGARAWVSADVIAFGSSSDATPNRMIRIAGVSGSLE